MDSSRRAVESYWRSRMIDGATSDEDKVTPVYKLEEICELLRSSHVSIVKEVSEFILKRLDHKSPVVKQKALRLIKYAVGKSGVEFRREMQRHSVAVRQLFHYKGHLDPLKGDALNKAVRDTAHEAISAIFSEEDNKPAPSEGLYRRIQGFGNTNYEMPTEDKKSFLSEVVGLGSASIKQGLSSFTQGHSLRKNDTGSYKSPNLRRSLTTETDYGNRYEAAEYHNEPQGSFGFSNNMTSGSSNQESGVAKLEMTNGDSSSRFAGNKTREERLLDTVATSGGVRLQPTRDAIQAFLLEAAKLDALSLSRALESKLKSPLWQVRMKAVCVLESILRKKDDEHFSIVASYFSENQDVVIRCSESPQASLREKANKVLILLGGGQASTSVANAEKSVISETSTVVQMPDLIDTGDPDDYNGTEESMERPIEQNIANLNVSTAPLIDDLFGDGQSSGLSTSEPKNNDPFSDVSFHTTENKDHEDDLFSGMKVDGNQGASENYLTGKKNDPSLFDIFGSNSELPKQEPNRKDVSDLMTGLSINEGTLKIREQGNSSAEQSESLFSDASSHPNIQSSKDDLMGMFSSQNVGINVNAMFSPGAMPYNMPPGMMLNPAISSQPMNYAAMGNLFSQQQFLATMSNFQQYGYLNPQDSGGINVAGAKGGFSSPLPDVFQPSFPNLTPSSVTNGSKKEETRAFDFISDHLAAARDAKRIG